ncbi:MAG: antitoxin component YwqK of YwqJK toxin-antitoxin module [Polaribacter sp.]|jgi:antitoxin component YwqK of YwqJK toxin-antitoxin module
MAIRYLINNSFWLLIVIVGLAGCSGSKQLTSVLVENANGSVELIYAGIQSPENLVKEVRYSASGDTLSITPMKKGCVHGTVSHFHSGNKLKECVPFQNGVQSGVYQRYDNEEVLVFEGKLEKGLKEGTWTTWYDEVQMEEQRNYSKDVADGKWTYWYIDGNLKRMEVYNLGKLIEEENFN